MTMTEPTVEQDPGTPHHHRKPLVLAGAGAAVLAAGAVYVAGWTPVMGVHTVEVQGATTIESAQLVSAAGIADGTPMMRVDVRAATARIADLPQVASVDVRRQWPRTVVVTVTERQAVATQKAGDGWELLDANGNPFALAPGKPKDLPTMQRSEDPATNTAMLQALTRMSADVRSQVVSISAESPNSIRLLLRAKDAVVNWGSAEQSDFKSEVLSVLLTTKSGWYDVSNPQTPTTAAEQPNPAAKPTPSPDVTAQPSELPSPAPSPTATPTPVTSPAPAESAVGVVQPPD